MKTKTLILLLTFRLMFFTTTAQIPEKAKFKMFCSALDNISTAPNYVVVTVKNLKTGEKKEICTEAPFIEGAIGQETGNWGINCKNYRTRYFELAKDSALWNVSFDLYTKTEFDKFAKTLNVDLIVEQVKSGKLDSKIFMGDRKEQVMFAHLMFNNGIMMTRGCISGNICGLTYFKEK